MTLGPDSRALSLRVSVTDRCSLRCVYCAPGSVVVKAAEKEMLSFEAITSFVRLLKARFGLAEMRLTGGEPLLRPRIHELVAMLTAEGVTDLALTTSGQQLAVPAGALKRAGLKRVNISLDSLDPKTFTELTGGGDLDRTLAGIEAALSAGLHPVKLNVVVLRGWNDKGAADLVRFGAARGCPVRFLELMPIGVAETAFEDRFVPSAELLERLRRDFVLTPLPVDPRSTSRNYSARDSSGRVATVGFISPVSEPFCFACPRLRLTASGMLLGCLARPDGISLASLLRNGAEWDLNAVAAAVEQMLAMKRRDGAFLQPRAMVGIGG
jgi:cyclic pyranopterin phosphate synthase